MQRFTELNENVCYTHKKGRLKMTKAELIAKIAADTKFTTPRERYIIDRVIEGLVAVIEEELVNGKRVRLTGFGRFEVIHRKGSQRRNPRTGELVATAPRRAVSFHPSKKLTEKIN